MVQGKLSDKDGAFKIIADNAQEVKMKDVEEYKRILATQKKNGDHKKIPKKINIQLPPSSSQKTIKDLSEILKECSTGKTKVYLTLNETQMETSFSINYEQKTEDKIKSLIEGININKTL